MAGILRPLLRRLGVMPGWKMPLVQALADAGGLNSLDYTASTWNALAAAVAAGQTVLDDPEVTQQQVDDAADNISDAIGQLADWTPAEEFSSGEQGVWFDPSDLTTLYQDSAGTTPVTGDGQPVGLMLDKSQGLELGPELVVNGDFSSQSDWVQGAGWSIVDGQAIREEAGSGATISQLIDFNPTNYYLIEVDIDEVDPGPGIVDIRLLGGIQIRSPAITSTGVLRFYMQPNETSDRIAIATAPGDATVTVNSISVKEIPGHHRTQDTTAAKPTFSDSSLVYDNVDDYLPWMPPEYTGMISMAIAYRLNSGTYFQSWSSMVGENGNVLGLSRESDNGSISAPSAWHDVLIRINGEYVDIGTYRRGNLYDDAVNGECIGVAEGVDWNLGNPGVDTTPRQAIRYAAQPTSGGVEIAYIEVEKPAFDDLPRLEHWLAKKAGITL